MTIKQQGGVFGRNPTFNNVEVDGALDVAGSVTTGAQVIDGTVEATKDGDAAGIFRRESSNGVVVQIYKDTNEAGRLGVFGTNDLWIGNNTCGVAFSDGLSSIYPVTTVGSGAGTNGTLDLGYSGVGFRDLYLTGNVVIGTSGKGIDFSATAGTGTSELFDDYEEGTWTPTTAGDATGALSSVVGQYTKVGNVVHCYVAFDVSVNFTSNEIGGLPYTPNNTATVSGVQGLHFIYSSTAQTGGLILNGSNSILLKDVSTNADHTPNTTANVYRGYFSYRTT